MTVNSAGSVRAAAQATVRPGGEATPVQVAVLKKALDAQKREGEALIDLLQTKGRLLDVRA